MSDHTNPAPEPFLIPKLIPMRLCALTYWGSVTCAIFDQERSSGAAEVTALVGAAPLLTGTPEPAESGFPRPRLFLLQLLTVRRGKPTQIVEGADPWQKS